MGACLTLLLRRFLRRQALLGLLGQAPVRCSGATSMAAQGLSGRKTVALQPIPTLTTSPTGVSCPSQLKASPKSSSGIDTGGRLNLSRPTDQCTAQPLLSPLQLQSHLHGRAYSPSSRTRVCTTRAQLEEQQARLRQMEQAWLNCPEYQAERKKLAKQWADYLALDH